MEIFGKIEQGLTFLNHPVYFRRRKSRFCGKIRETKMKYSGMLFKATMLLAIVNIFKDMYAPVANCYRLLRVTHYGCILAVYTGWSKRVSHYQIIKNRIRLNQ